MRSGFSGRGCIGTFKDNKLAIVDDSRKFVVPIGFYAWTPVGSVDKTCPECGAWILIYRLGTPEVYGCPHCVKQWEAK